MSIIKEETVKLLNEHLNLEHYSANLYFNMAGWCEKEGLKGCSVFLYNHSAEEHTHLEKFREFINKAGGQAIMGEMKAPEFSFNNVGELFEKVIKHEEYITSCINKLVGIAIDNKDYVTLKFLEWFVEEQLEEEELFNDIIKKIKILGDLQGRNLYTFDKYVGNLDSREHNS
ncbi:ferritin [Brachyspira innocens]|uniref:ferritin n=1 Tax=Brachyspira innocens TaxID=13264 RepID=UPI000372546A|nr:ferritin-like domain-containing protein [Brachyspira innocens]